MPVLVAVAGLATVLSACSGGDNSASSTSSSAPGSTAPASTSSSVSSTPQDTSTPSNPGGTPPTSKAPGTTSSTSAPTSSTTSTSTGGGCDYARVAPSIVSTGGAAGSTILTIRLTNNGTATCPVTGFPGVSIVGNGNGTQIGAPAIREAETPSQVSLSPGKSSTFAVRVGQAANYPADQCSPTKADGLRIYAPGSRTAVFLKWPVTGCAKTGVNLLHVRPMGTIAG